MGAHLARNLIGFDNNLSNQFIARFRSDRDRTGLYWLIVGCLKTAKY